VLPGLACQQVSKFFITFYGWPDNDPPGTDIAYDCGRGNTAAGTGTFADPLTMAAAVGIFTECQVVYSPYLKKYLRFEDICADCRGNWMDVWLGSFLLDGGDALGDCELTLTGADKATHMVLKDPPQDLPVDGMIVLQTLSAGTYTYETLSYRLVRKRNLLPCEYLYRQRFQPVLQLEFGVGFSVQFL
jgi:hypothetical protein